MKLTMQGEPTFTLTDLSLAEVKKLQELLAKAKSRDAITKRLADEFSNIDTGVLRPMITFITPDYEMGCEDLDTEIRKRAEYAKEMSGKRGYSVTAFPDKEDVCIRVLIGAQGQIGIASGSYDDIPAYLYFNKNALPALQTMSHPERYPYSGPYPLNCSYIDKKTERSFSLNKIYPVIYLEKDDINVALTPRQLLCVGIILDTL